MGDTAASRTYPQVSADLEESRLGTEDVLFPERKSTFRVEKKCRIERRRLL
jgi:hypothetical protein